CCVFRDHLAEEGFGFRAALPVDNLFFLIRFVQEQQSTTERFGGASKEGLRLGLSKVRLNRFRNIHDLKELPCLFRIQFRGKYIVGPNVGNWSHEINYPTIGRRRMAVSWYLRKVFDRWEFLRGYSMRNNYCQQEDTQ